MEPKVMGILNITPDSFFSGSRKQTEREIAGRVLQMACEGAEIIDVGGYSSRPNAVFVSPEEEWQRLQSGLEILFRELPDATVSIDTFRADVARRCIEQFGKLIINDISGGELDVTMYDTVAEFQVPYILMHMRGTPQTMMQNTHYDDLMGEMTEYFSGKIRILEAKGVKDITIDPGFGFSKTTPQNYEVLAKMEQFQVLNYPVLVGFSRKTMIREILGVSSEEALNGTTALNMAALMKGAAILRVHDVKEAVETVKLYKSIHYVS
jgi:dihydropteroate synthase